MQFTLLTAILLAGAAWYGWRAWSAVKSGVVEARFLPLPGLPVERFVRAENPKAFRRPVGVFIAFGTACAVLAILHASGVLPPLSAP